MDNKIIKKEAIFTNETETETHRIAKELPYLNKNTTKKFITNLNNIKDALKKDYYTHQCPTKQFFGKNNEMESLDKIDEKFENEYGHKKKTMRPSDYFVNQPNFGDSDEEFDQCEYNITKTPQREADNLSEIDNPSIVEENLRENKEEERGNSKNFVPLNVYNNDLTSMIILRKKNKKAMMTPFHKTKLFKSTKVVETGSNSILKPSSYSRTGSLRVKLEEREVTPPLKSVHFNRKKLVYTFQKEKKKEKRCKSNFWDRNERKITDNRKKKKTKFVQDFIEYKKQRLSSLFE